MRASVVLTLLLLVVAALSQSPPTPNTAGVTKPSAPETKAPPKDGEPKLEPPAPGMADPGIAPPKDDGIGGAPILAPGQGGVSDVFIYDPTGKRDPFEPDIPKEAIPQPKVIQETPAQQEEVAEQAPKQTRPLEPLEAYDLAQLKVAAIIWDTKNPRAMITDPQKETHFVHLKSRIGRHNGFIAAIREGEIVVVEYGQENGQYTKYFKVLELR